MDRSFARDTCLVKESCKSIHHFVSSTVLLTEGQTNNRHDQKHNLQDILIILIFSSNAMHLANVGVLLSWLWRRMRSCMKKISLLLCWRIIMIIGLKKYITRRRKHRHSIADAPQSSSATSASTCEGSPKPSATLSHRINIADVYTSKLGTSPMCRRCVNIFNLRVPYRMFATLVRYSALFGDK